MDTVADGKGEGTPGMRSRAGEPEKGTELAGTATEGAHRGEVGVHVLWPLPFPQGLGKPEERKR